MKTIWLEKILSLFFVGVVFLLISGSAGGSMEKKQHAVDQLQTVRQIPPQKWDGLAQKKIFFGHQSVGNNIMQGVEEIISSNPDIKLNVVETRDAADLEKPVFAHYANIGKNHQPLLKIEDFVQLMNDGFGDKLDIAFLKFCFVDLNSGTDIKHIFERYKENIAKLNSRYPGLTIVHFTVPLLRKEPEAGIVKSMKNFIKELMGKKKDDFFSNSHNAVRNEFNKLLLTHYEGKEPIFDLALLEATNPAGKRETFSYDGNEYYALTPDYTDDGGHLNEKGRKYIAGQLLVFLANL